MPSRTILITGASSGLGAATARRLARPGVTLALAARRLEQLEEVARDIRSRGGEAIVLATDLAEPDAAEQLGRDALKALGRLDVLVNNAGLGLAKFYHRSEPADLRRQLAVNVSAPILLTRQVLPALIESRGMVINIGSVISTFECPVMGVYSTTKATIAHWSTALRREVRHLGVRVCLVEPGPFATGFMAAMEAKSSAEIVNTPQWTRTTAEETADRVARLIDRPRRRVSIPWSFGIVLRSFCGCARALPFLSDPLSTRIIRWMKAD